MFYDDNESQHSKCYANGLMNITDDADAAEEEVKVQGHWYTVDSAAPMGRTDSSAGGLGLLVYIWLTESIFFFSLPEYFQFVLNSRRDSVVAHKINWVFVNIKCVTTGVQSWPDLFRNQRSVALIS